MRTDLPPIRQGRAAYWAGDRESWCLLTGIAADEWRSGYRAARDYYETSRAALRANAEALQTPEGILAAGPASIPMICRQLCLTNKAGLRAKIRRWLDDGVVEVSHEVRNGLRSPEIFYRWVAKNTCNQVHADLY